MIFNSSFPNITNNVSGQITEFMTPFYIISNGLSLIIAIVTVMLNGIVIWAISRRREWDLSYSALWHLSVVDNINGLLLFYNVMYNLFYFQSFYECLFRYGCLHGVKVTSAYLFLGIGLERYIRLITPYHYWTILTPKIVRLYITGTWFIGLVYACLPYITWMRNMPEENFCQYFSVLKPNFISSFCVAMFLAVFFQSLIYSHVFIIAVKALKSAPHGILQKGSSFSLWWKPTKRILIVVGLNFITMGPIGAYLLCVVIGVLDDKDVIEKGILLTYCATPAYLVSMMNPLVYAFKVKEIQKIIITQCKILRMYNDATSCSMTVDTTTSSF